MRVTELVRTVSRHFLYGEDSDIELSSQHLLGWRNQEVNSLSLLVSCGMWLVAVEIAITVGYMDVGVVGE